MTLGRELGTSRVQCSSVTAYVRLAMNARGAGYFNPAERAHVIRHFQERMPYGLFVPEVE